MFKCLESVTWFLAVKKMFFLNVFPGKISQEQNSGNFHVLHIALICLNIKKKKKEKIHCNCIYSSWAREKPLKKKKKNFNSVHFYWSSGLLNTQVWYVRQPFPQNCLSKCEARKTFNPDLFIHLIPKGYTGNINHKKCCKKEQMKLCVGIK